MVLMAEPLRNIMVNNLVCDTDIAFIMNHPIHIDACQRNQDSLLSTIRHITLKNISIRTDGRLLFTAADGTSVSDITIDGIHIDYALFCDPAAIAEGTTSMQSSASSPDAQAARAAIVAKNIDHLRIRDARITWLRAPTAQDGVMAPYALKTVGPDNFQQPITAMRSFSKSLG